MLWLSAPIARIFAVVVCVVIALAMLACGEPVAEVPDAPVAALQHPEIAKTGERIRFDAAGSWVDSSAQDVAREGATLVRFDFLFADGSAAKSTAANFAEHTFTSPGTYAVSVTAYDDLGRASVASSTIAVAADYTSTCGGTSVGACASFKCLGDRCAVVACAGDRGCEELGASTGSTACLDGVCKPPKP